jgi:DNA-binding PadR family transcriptional regulator
MRWPKRFVREVVTTASSCVFIHPIYYVERNNTPRSNDLRYYAPRSIVFSMSEPKRTSTSTRVNDPPILILTSLASGPKHGYALMQDIEGFAGVRLGPGSLYGAISRLEERGLIEPLGAVSRTRPYQLTSAGRDALEATLAGLRTVVDEATTRLARAPQVAIAGGCA